MTKEELDAKVLESIRSGRSRAGAVQSHLQMTGITGARDIDKSLQRLRRRGSIQYESKTGWRVAT